MREILFRGKSTETGKWREGCLLNVTLDGVTYNLVFGDDFARSGTGVTAMAHSCAYPETVGQYTGLTDKNGKKIFEGDIWKRGDVCGVVRWDDEEARFIVAYEIGGIKYQNAFSERRINTIEIIGNIHDNPELLEGGAGNG